MRNINQLVAVLKTLPATTDPVWNAPDFDNPWPEVSAMLVAASAAGGVKFGWGSIDEIVIDWLEGNRDHGHYAIRYEMNERDVLALFTALEPYSVFCDYI